MQLKFDIHDNATPKLQYLTERFPNTTRGAIKSVGYWLKGQFQTDIVTDDPGGVPYPEFGNPKFRQMLERLLNGRGKTKYLPYGKLTKAIRYRYTPSRSRGYAVTIGFVNSSAYNLAGKLARGFSSPMTDQRRKAWDKAFQMLGWKTRVNPNKTAVDVPARPVIVPMWEQKRAEAMQVFEKKFYEYLANDLNKGR